jgi:signal transduction histidine kinase
MEAVYESPGAVDATGWQALCRRKLRRIFRPRRSSLVVSAYVLLNGFLLLGNQVDNSLAYASIVATLAVCVLYTYFVRSEERQERVGELQILAARAEELGEELRQCTAEKLIFLEQLERQREFVEKARRVKDQFLGVLSHELRTPLNVVMGYARLLKDRMLGDLDTIQAEAIAKIVAHTREQLAMVTDILEVTSLNAGEAALRSQEIALSGLLDDLQSDHDVPQRQNFDIVWDYADDLPVVKTDGEKLKHLLSNLVDNAIKFTHRGAVRVSARLLPPPDGAVPTKKYIEFCVADTGIGIAPEHLPRIFDLFHQVDGSTTRAYGGVGMGLYVVKRLAELLGAEVAVESEQGRGSIFTVTLACDEAAKGRVKNNPLSARSAAEREAQVNPS